MGGWAIGGLAVLLSVCPPIRLSAQSDPRLVDAVRLAQAGRHDSARAIVNRLVSSLAPTDSVYPEALYTAGVLGLDTRTITTNLQRVVVEYGHSPWADDALLRLTQFSFAQGDHASTVQSAERLRRDYPDSPLKPRAEFGAARAYFQLGDEASGCALIRGALDAAGDDVELKNQAEFYSARCPVAARAPAPDTARPVAPRGFSVQVLAVRTPQPVDEMLTRLKVMGFTAHVVRDTTGFFKVRVGPYPSRAEADRARARLRTRLGGQPFIVEEP
ncbi:MAG: SPOR domain-containing protein [Gemmatimonadales bacterium]